MTNRALIKLRVIYTSRRNYLCYLGSRRITYFRDRLRACAWLAENVRPTHGLAIDDETSAIKTDDVQAYLLYREMGIL